MVRRRRMDSCTRLMMNVLELLGMVMNVFVIMVIRETGQSGEGSLL